MTGFEPQTSGYRKRPLYQLSHNHKQLNAWVKVGLSNRSGAKKSLE